MTINSTEPGLARKNMQIIATAPGASAQAIYTEIDKCVARFAETGESATVDLRCLQSMPDERENLARLLGRGRVLAVLGALRRMRTDIQETAIPGVWWIRLRNRENQTVGELIEITGIPDVIAGDRKAIAEELEDQHTVRLFHPANVLTAHH